MRTDRGEAGFSLLELVVCVGLLVVASVLALALTPGLVRESQAQLVRTAATDVARNALERARAAAAYYPPTGVATAAQRAVTTASHAFALAPQASARVAVRLHRAACGGAAATTDVPLDVASNYDASADVLTVTVQYPPDPCRPGATRAIALSARLATAAYAPQTGLVTAIADPATQ